MNCPACHAPLFSETLEGESALAVAAGPYRSSALVDRLQAASATVYVDRCRSCRGIWFDRGEMSEAIQRLEIVDVPTVERERLQPPVSPGPRRCPRCKRTMEAVQSTAAPSVTFSRCGSCHGSWFDREVHVALLALMIRDFF